MRPTIGARVRYWREFRAMTQTELAEVSGIGRAHINRIEAGKIPNPSVETIITLARALRVSIAWLIVDPLDSEHEGVPSLVE